MIKDQSNLLGITFVFTLQQQKVLFVFILRNIDIFQKYIDQIDFGKMTKESLLSSQFCITSLSNLTDIFKDPLGFCLRLSLS